jgi:hypothetical protein
MVTQRNAWQNRATKADEAPLPKTDPALGFEWLFHKQSGARPKAMCSIRDINGIAQHTPVADVDCQHGRQHTIRANVHIISDPDAPIQRAAAVRIVGFQFAVSHYMGIPPDANSLGIQYVPRKTHRRVGAHGHAARTIENARSKYF